MVSAGKFSRMKSCFQPHSREWSIQRLLSIFFSFFLSFCFFSCHPELSRQYFLKLQLSQTVLADNFTVVEHLAGYLFASQAGCTWLCKRCEQMQWWECDGQGGGCLSTTDRGPSTRVRTIHDFICQEFCMWAVQHSLDPFAGITMWDSSSLGAFERAVFPLNPCSKTLGIPQCVPLYPISSTWQ